MTRRSDTVVVPHPARSRLAVRAAYGAQGLGYAVVVTSLPLFKQRQGIDDTAVSLIVLMVCLAAAAGSVLADVVAKRGGSRIALSGGLLLEAVGIVVIAAGPPLPLFIAAFAVYGVGLGAVDASAAMQGVLVQRRGGTDLMGGFFASYTAAAIVGALTVAGAGALSLGASALVLALLVSAAVGLWGLFAFDPERSATTPGDRTSARLPRSGIWLFGFVILAAFTLDSGVSTWSTVYLGDTLLASAGIAPLGYAAYQVAILLTRLATDGVVRRRGPRPVVIGATILSLVGLACVALVPFTGAAIAGFALAGVAVGALVPLAFTSAGELRPARSDEVIARVNLFNYAGAVLGAVVIGLLSEGPGLGLAFLIPGVLLLPVLLIVRRFRAASAAAGDAGADAAAPASADR